MELIEKKGFGLDDLCSFSTEKEEENPLEIKTNPNPNPNPKPKPVRKKKNEKNTKKRIGETEGYALNPTKKIIRKKMEKKKEGIKEMVSEREYKNFYMNTNKEVTEDLERDIKKELRLKIELEKKISEEKEGNKEEEKKPKKIEKKNLQNDPKRKKYQKKLNIEKGRFSKFDNEAIMAEVNSYFGGNGNEFLFEGYNEDDPLLKKWREKNKEKDMEYRNAVRLSVNEEKVEKVLNDQKENINLKDGNWATSEYFSKAISKNGLEKVTPSYCREFECQPLPNGEEIGERLCANREGCIGIIAYMKSPDSIEDSINGNGFICREFLLPSELQKWEIEKVLPEICGLCILCRRYESTNLFEIHAEENTSPQELIQDHWNSISTENEIDGYSLENCLPPVQNRNSKSGPRKTGIELPILKFSKSDYIPQMRKRFDPRTKEFIEVKCFVERPLNFRKAPAVIATKAL